MVFDDIDKFYFLHLSDRHDRENWMRSQIKQIGLPEDKVNIWWTCRRKISNSIGENIPAITKNYQKWYNEGNTGIYGGAFNCSFEHYTIIRTSYERGFKYIIIFEDDVKFQTSLDILKYFIENLPEDWDICKLHNNVWIYDNKMNGKLVKPATNLLSIPNTIEDCIEPLFYIEKNDFASTAAYMLNRKAMLAIIKAYDNQFEIADKIFKFLDEDIKIYVPKYQIVSTQDYKCAPWDYLWSDLWRLDSTTRFNQIK